MTLGCTVSIELTFSITSLSGKLQQKADDDDDKRRRRSFQARIDSSAASSAFSSASASVVSATIVSSVSSASSLASASVTSASSAFSSPASVLGSSVSTSSSASSAVVTTASSSSSMVATNSSAVISAASASASPSMIPFDELEYDEDYLDTVEDITGIEDDVLAGIEASLNATVDGFDYVAITDLTGDYSLFAWEDGNFYLVPTTDGQNTEFASLDSVIVGANDDDTFFYYPDEMKALGVSRWRQGDEESIPLSAEIVGLVPLSKFTLH